MDNLTRVALCLDQDLGYRRDIQSGIHRYASEKTNWVLRPAMPTMETFSRIRDWKPHGVICHILPPELARALMTLDCPIVTTTTSVADLNLPLVQNDHELIGRWAADYFLDQGYQNFGFYGGARTAYTQGREVGFRTRLAEQAATASVCYEDQSPDQPFDQGWRIGGTRVREWLQRMPKPVAILAGQDISARVLADTCFELSVRVPDDVAIMGVDNDETECGAARPPLSSIEVCGMRVGFLSAQMLDQLMHGVLPEERTILVPPVRIVVRQSTDILAIRDSTVAEALQLIRERLSAEIGVAQLAKSLGVSRRVLEMKFNKSLGRTVLQEIRRVRVEKAKELLSRTNLDMEEVARRSGFSGARRLAVVFGEFAGVAPSIYRRQSQFQKPAGVERPAQTAAPQHGRS
jgi:LacI family transcriptional regulator